MISASQLPLSRPHQTSGANTLRFALIGRVVAVAVLGLLAAGGLAFADFHRDPTSAALLQPLIEHHTKQSAAQLDRVGNVFRDAGGLLTYVMKDLRSAARSAYRGCTRPQTPDDIVVLTDWQQARNSLLSVQRYFGLLGDRIWNMVWHFRMLSYHIHASEHYSRLFAARVTALPSLPLGLVAERRAAEAEYLRFYGIKYTLPPEPPPHLVPARR